MKKTFLALILALFASSFAFADDKVLEEIARRQNMSIMEVKEAIEVIARQENKSVAEVKEALETGCDSGGTVSMTVCGLYHFMIADIALNDIYKKVKEQLKTESALEALKKAQRAWIAYRDAVCEYECEGYTGGNIYKMVHLGCMQQYTTERTTHLREYLDCKDLGCPGIVE